MKFMYFLQTLREVPLGYNFTIYSYGPFDSDVLADLSMAESLGAVRSTPVSFSGGFGYRIEPSSNSAALKAEAGDFLQEHDEDIKWVIEEFGRLNSAELELFSTVVYVDQEMKDAGNTNGRADVAWLVRELKPHFKDTQIESSIEWLRNKGLLTSV
jgi:hypothetical protein